MAVLWCGASAWHRPAPRGEKSHRPAPTPQAGAKKLIAPPQRPRPGRKSHRPAPTPRAPQRPGAQKMLRGAKTPRGSKNAPVLNINTYFILKNKRKKEQLKNNRFIFSIKQQPRLYIAFIILIIARLKNE